MAGGLGGALALRVGRVGPPSRPAFDGALPRVQPTTRRSGSAPELALPARDTINASLGAASALGMAAFVGSESTAVGSAALAVAQCACRTGSGLHSGSGGGSQPGGTATISPRL